MVFPHNVDCEGRQEDARAAKIDERPPPRACGFVRA
jgi:hypothetical protein